ncbi:MAG: type II toxin-antitoxin system HicB family antitoxin [Deltaproteobacteria bacterium]|nr:type II toxin-antitoxin system HicB family antitoxin [Deltaproteobacteria bacterium]
MTLTYPIVLVQEDNQWWAYIPDLPGVYGAGATEEAAKKDIVSALELYIEDLREDGKPIPASHIKKLETDNIQVSA